MNQARLARVLRNMERDGLTQIVISSTASVYYLTGYWVEPMERMLALYIRADGTCRLFANALFALEPQEGLELVLHQDSDAPTAALSAALLPGTLGVDKAWPSKFLIALLAARPDVTPVLGSAPVDDARKYKDADEIAAMRRASQINDQVVEAAIAAVRAGAVESELAAYVEGLYRQHGADRSGEGQLVCFGPNGADPHHAPNGTVLRDGDSVVLDIFIPIRRYWCDMTRTQLFRSESDEGRREYETVKAANLAAEAVIRARAHHDIRLLCAVPHDHQSDRFPPSWKKRYNVCLVNSDAVRVFASNYFSGCFSVRNRFMVDSSSLLICYFDGQAGGTAQTVHYAQGSGLRIINLSPRAYDQLSLL